MRPLDTACNAMVAITQTTTVVVSAMVMMFVCVRAIMRVRAYMCACT